MEPTNEQIDALLDQIDTQRVEVERRMHGRLHHDTHIRGLVLNRRHTDRGYHLENGQPWSFDFDYSAIAVAAVLEQCEQVAA